MENSNELSFTVIEGSNYEVVFYDKVSEVISFEQYKKLANAIFNSQAKFIAINGIINAIADIRRIRPTTLKTPSEIRRRCLSVAKTLKEIGITKWGDFNAQELKALKEAGIDPFDLRNRKIFEDFVLHKQQSQEKLP